MSTKRILAAVLGILMLAVLAVPALAYTTPYTALQALTSASTSEFTISGNIASFDNFGDVAKTPGTKTATISLTDETGAWHLTNTGSSNTAYATGALGKTNTSNAYSNFVDNTRGMTFDLYAKFDELPVLATNTIMLDSGAPAKNPSNLYFSGLVFNLCSAEKYMVDTSKSNNELQAVFATYYNDELGTDTVLILPYGNRNAWASNSGAITYFFDNPGEYARYTITFDAANQTTQFFINGEAQVAAGDETAVHSGIGLSYRATATTNFLNINLNNAQTSVSEGTTDFCLDQLDVYPAALVPAADDFLFGDEAYEEPTGPVNANFTNAYNYYRDFDAMADEYFDPTFWNAFEGYINYGLDIIENGTQEELDAIANSGTGANWFINRLVFKSTAGVNVTTGGSAATVNGTGTVIPAHTPVLTGWDKLWISHIDTDGKDLPWSYSSTIVTEAGLNVGTDLTSFGGDLFTAYWRVYICEPTTVDGYFKLINLGGNTVTTRPVIPEGGFAIIMHTNSQNMTTLSTSAVEFNKYNSGLFFARNIHAVYSAGFANGVYVKLAGVDLEAGTMTQEGSFLTYKDPAMTDAIGDHVYRAGYITLDAADDQGRTAATRDRFAGFKSGAYIQPVSELPGETISVSVKGEGTVSATVNGTAVADPSSFNTAAGSTVTLTAEGEGFKYWIGGNSAILGTDATLTIPGGKAFTLTAVFEDAAEGETVNVYFKDSKTGKVWATKEVAVGSALVTDDVTASLKGYTFKGWSVAAGTVIEATTEVYSVYEKEEGGVKITITDGNQTASTVRAYGSVLALSAKGDNFSYWTLNGVAISTDRDYRFNTPSSICTIEAVYGATDAPEAIVSTVDLSLESVDSQTFYYLMSRSVNDGATIKETGVLMTRKASASDLTVDTTVNTVTRGVSTAPADHDVVGFVKDATAKAGTWLVRGYLTYEIDGVTKTIYTDVSSLEVGGYNYVPTTFTAMTHNISNSNSDGAGIAANVTSLGADVVGMQEVGSFYYSTIASAMQDAGYYAVQGSKRDNGLLNAEYNPIFYKYSKYLCHNYGTFWLSDTPDTMSKLDGLKYYRICTWAVLEDRQTGEFIQVFNTHLAASYSTEGVADTATVDLLRFEQVKALLGEMEEIARNCPSGVNHLVLLGDFNMNTTHGIVKYITGDAAYNGETNADDARLNLALAKNLAGMTGQYPTMGSADFDMIFVSDVGIKSVEAYGVGDSAAGSDHYPAYASATLNA